MKKKKKEKNERKKRGGKESTKRTWKGERNSKSIEIKGTGEIVHLDEEI